MIVDEETGNRETIQDLKQKGNQLFGKKQFAAAVQIYTKAIDSVNNSLNSSNDVHSLDSIQGTSSTETLNGSGTLSEQESASCSLLKSKSSDNTNIDNDTIGVLFSNRAAAYLELGSFQLALHDCFSALRYIPSQSKAQFRAAKAQMHIGNLSEAKELLKNLENNLNHKDAKQTSDLCVKEISQIDILMKKIESFKTCIRKERYTEALDHIESAMIIVDPALLNSGLPNSVSKVDTNQMSRISPRWCLFRADSLLGLWDANEAGQIARAILRSDSKNAEAIYIVAKSMYLLESHPNATINQYLSTALSFDPDNLNARTLFKTIKKLEAIKKQGNEAYKKGEWNDALEAYNSFCEMDQYQGITRAKVLSNRAIIYNKLSQHEAVIADSCSAIEILDKLCFPKEVSNNQEIDDQDRVGSSNPALYIKNYLRRAAAFNALEEYEKAIKDYTSAGTFEKTQEIVDAIRRAQRDIKMKSRKDYYKILGIDKNSTSSEIKRGYRKAALIYHPDKQASLGEEERLAAEIKFKEIGEAYSVLSDDRKKRMYDSGQDIDGMSASAGEGGFGHHGHGFGGHHGFGGASGVRMEDLFGGGGGGFHFGGF